MKNTFLYDLFNAYYDARKNKRNTTSQIAFEVDYESNLLKLYQELLDGTYNIGSSTCFLICDTVPREIFAADFRDRIVHHLVYNYIYRICDIQFIHDSYSCRIGKGTHYGVRRVESFIRSCSKGYAQDCYVLKMDIKGFFMNINKEILKYELRQMIARKKETIQCSLGFEKLRRLIVQIIDHNPLDNYIFHGSKELYKVLPQDKSLFSCDPGVGLPIGNLTSQLFANIYLHRFDVWMKEAMGCIYYGRYVDDFVIIHHDKAVLTNLMAPIREFLCKNLGLQLHPKKIYLQHYMKGVKFLGAYIKPYRTYINNRTLFRGQQKFKSIAYKLTNHGGLEFRKAEIQTVLKKELSSINSYLGMMYHRKNYNKRKELCRIVSMRYESHLGYAKCKEKRIYLYKKHNVSRKSTSI